jgi:ABC-type lipopolysaccharide export system ATPase subunit
VMPHTLVPVFEVRSTMSTITMLIISMAPTFLIPFVSIAIIITMMFLEMPGLLIATLVIGPWPVVVFDVRFIMTFLLMMIIPVLVTDRNMDRFAVVMWVVIIMIKNVIIQANGKAVCLARHRHCY